MIIHGRDRGNEYFLDGKLVSSERFHQEEEKIPTPWYPEVWIGDIKIRRD